jgi:glycosyltransferase involved in cell wall biosynthesis
MKVVFITRAKNPLFFSLERVFQLVKLGFGSNVQFQEVTLPFLGFKLGNYSFARRAARNADKNAIFHVTGDTTYVVGALPGERTVFTMHDMGFLKQYQGLKFKIVKWLYVDIPVKRARMITTISEQTKQEIIHYTNCSPAKIKVIPNPVDTFIRFIPKPFNSNKPKLLFLGSTPNKNLDRALEALKDFSCELWIVGQPGEKQRALLKEYQIDHHIEHGISNEEIARRYAETDIVLFPTLYEGFGLPILEGFRAGRVVLTSNIVPMKDIAADAACLVDPLDSKDIRRGLDRLVSDPVYRETLVKKGFDVAKQYEPNRIARLYEEVYQQIV